MRENKIFHSCLLVLAATVLFCAGCKLQITVPEGGAVISSSAVYDCESGQVCTIDIYDLFFDEEFIADPAPGYRFIGWRKLDRSLCAHKSTPCRIESAHAQKHPNLMKLLESDAVFYLEPIFEDELAAKNFTGLTSQQLAISLTVFENRITQVDFIYQQLGEVPPAPECRHEISMELSAPLDAEGNFAAEVSLLPQTSSSGKLQLLAFDGRLSGSVGDFEIRGGWDFTELEILCEKSTGETLRNFCGERFLPCIDAIDFSFDAERVP